MILRAFVKSANGVMHEKQKVVGQYEQTVWPHLKNRFTCCSMGLFTRHRGSHR